MSSNKFQVDKDPFWDDSDQYSFFVEHKFPSDFVVDRPYGTQTDDLLFLHFRSTVNLKTSRWDRAASRGGCILLAPGEPFFIRGDGKHTLTLDSMYLSASLLRSSGSKKPLLPLNEPFYPLRTDFIPIMITQIKQEVLHKRLHWKSFIKHGIMLLILSLSRYTPNVDVENEEQPDADLAERLRTICQEINDNLQHDWTAKELALMSNLSRSRFSHMFHHFIGESPRDYIINSRLLKAIILLTNTHLSMAEIAEECGFQSPYYFSRIFTKRIGCPPSQYNDRFSIP